MFIWFIMFFAIFSLAIVIYLYFSGLFHKINIKCDVPNFGTVCLAYKFHKGSYSEIGSAFSQLCKLCSLRKVDSIGIYYDDPEIICKGKQRYAIGIVLNDKDLNLDSNLENLLIKNGYKISWITKIDNAVLSEFPCVTALSPILAVFFVYPRLQEFIRRKKLCAYPYVEYNSKYKTHFVVPLCEQEKFFLPEYYDSEINDSYYSSIVKHNFVKTEIASMNQESKFFLNKNSSSRDKKRI